MRATRATTPFEREFPGGSESANACVVALVQAGEAFVSLATRALRRHGLTAAGAQVLGIIDGAGKPISPTLIAERLIVTTATVTTLLDTLERRGFVVRQPDPGDRRRVLVALTDKARETTDVFLPQIVALQTAVMAGVGEPERLALAGLLAGIAADIESVDADAVIAAARPRGARQRPSS